MYGPINLESLGLRREVNVQVNVRANFEAELHSFVIELDVSLYFGIAMLHDVNELQQGLAQFDIH